MGLFDFLKKTPVTKTSSAETSTNQKAKELLDKVDPGFRQRQADLNYQNELLSRVNAAREKYKIDKDLESAIKEYEYAFVESKPPCATSQDIDLANLYIKAEQYDKAWGYLNQLILRRSFPDPEIKFYQARILKKEGKYAYAIEMIAIGYYYKSIPNKSFQVEKFHKDISSSAKKLGWDQSKIDSVTKIVTSYSNKDNSEETKLIKQLRDFMKDDYQS